MWPLYIEANNVICIVLMETMDKFDTNWWTWLGTLLEYVIVWWKKMHSRVTNATVKGTHTCTIALGRGR